MKQNNFNVLGLDWGKARIGIAIIKKGLSVPFLREAVQNNDTALDKIAEIYKAEEIEKIVIGLPYELSGEEKTSAQKVREFGKNLEEKLKCEVEFFDERFTSTIANRKLQGFEKQSKKKSVDSLSAAEILEGWLMKS